LHANPLNPAENQPGEAPRRFSPGRAGPQGPLLAVLDLGTNNCRLLIAAPQVSRSGQQEFRIVDSFSRIVRLGEGVGQSGLLSDAALERTVAALKVCAEHIARHRVTRIRAIATQAARLARNSDVLVARARAEAGIDLDVISADEEADLAALGCAPLIGRKYRGALVFDIGGGSTEVIWLAKTPAGPQKRFSASLPVGVVSLAEQYGAGAQGRDGFERICAVMRERFAPLTAQTAGFDTRKFHLLGTSGTVTTLAAIALDLPRYNRNKVDASWHETRRMLKIVDDLAGMDLASLSRVGSIGPERADLMLPGCAIFAAICSLWPSAMLRVADRGLREGMLRQLAAGLAEKTA
jgi:exopolyphosphatase/guanosine-5'-triphosphate,3'-diphosphate pyrophosphatase